MAMLEDALNHTIFYILTEPECCSAILIPSRPSLLTMSLFKILKLNSFMDTKIMHHCAFKLISELQGFLEDEVFLAHLNCDPFLSSP